MSNPVTLEAAKAALAQNQVSQAERLFDQLLNQSPDNPEIRLNYALCLVQQNRFDDALAQLDILAQRYGPVPPVAANKGEILRRMGRFDEAVSTLSALVRQQPDMTPARFNLALALRGAGQLVAAIEEYRRALAQQPGHGDGWFNLGNACLDNGQLDDAIDSYRKALERMPETRQAGVLNNLASALIIQHRPAEAIDALQQALDRQPDYAEAELNLAKALEQAGRLEEADGRFRRLASVQPDQWWHELHADGLCPDVYDSNAAIDHWRENFAKTIAHWSARPGSLPPEMLHLSGAEPSYKLMYQGREDRELKVAYARMLAPRLPEIEAPQKRSGADRLRIALVVSRGHEGIFARSLAGQLPLFDRQRFEITLAVSASVLAKTQALLPVEGIHWLPLAERVDQAAEQLRQSRQDLLYHWEVGTDAFNYFLPWFRAAPVQYTSWAWPMTTGIPAMDYFLSSDLVEPEHAQCLYSEQLLCMPNNMFTYAEPPLSADNSIGRGDFGFSERDHLYLCHQNPRKIHPDFDALIADILQRDPNGRLVLIGGKEANEAELLQRRLDRNLGALAKRVVFMPRLPRDRYLALLNSVDVALDPPHYTGANTSFDALGLGLPVITLRSRLLRGNVSSGLYRQMGQAELVADNAADYVSKALAMAGDAERRAHCSQQLRDGAEAIFHDRRAVTELEDAWQRMVGL